jgi:DNA excision repair protein ERCC-6
MDIGTPTWTGRSGAAGAPRQFLEDRSGTPPPRFGKRSPAFSTNSAPGSPSTNNKFGSGIVSGFKTMNGGGKLSSGTLLARMRERKAMESGSTAIQGNYNAFRPRIFG